jgi:hypothetical protein
MQKKERKNKKSNNITSNLLQKETHTQIEVKNEKDKQKKKRFGIVWRRHANREGKKNFCKSERNNEIDFD